MLYYICASWGYGASLITYPKGVSKDMVQKEFGPNTLVQGPFKVQGPFEGVESDAVEFRVTTSPEESVVLREKGFPETPFR